MPSVSDQQNDVATDVSRDAKRRLLRSLVGAGAVGAALPASWTKPVVNVVMLPAHAQTTPMPPPPPPVNNAPVARLTGVEDGVENTTFVADASTSTDADGDTLTYNFMATGDCTIQARNGAQATVLRSDVAVSGTCNVQVDVGDGTTTTMALATSNVLDTPPPPP